MKCPRCGGELRFDPAIQLLKCDYCENTFIPSDVKDDAIPDAEEHVSQTDKETAGNAKNDHMADSFTPVDTTPLGEAATAEDIVSRTGEEETEVKDKQDAVKDADTDELKLVEYTCPNCGGTLYSVEESLNGFCSYCGSQVMLQSRFSSMKPPKGVIPFKVDKTKCKSIYEDHVKKSFFAPKELKDPNYLEQFRGIYIPYHVYNVELKGPLDLIGKKEYRRGDYVYTEKYVCHSDLDCYFHGLSYDASSSFDDHFSETIAPFDAHSIVPFEPAYLTGFYADMPDVGHECYAKDVTTFAVDEVYKSVSTGWPGGVSLNSGQKSKIPVHMTPRDIYTAFFPIWFLSYKKGDRVAYAVINGESGKISCDMPVNTRKFLAFCFLLAIPVYLLLAVVMPSMNPSKMIALIQTLGCICAFIMMCNVSSIVKKEKHLDDKGYMYKYSNDKDIMEALKKKEEKERKKREKENKKSGGNIWLVLAVILCLGQFIFVALCAVGYIGYAVMSSGMIQPLLTAVFIWMAFSKAKELTAPRIVYKGGIPLMVAAPLALIFSLVARASDPMFYVSAAIIGTGVIIGLISIVGLKNLLYTRPLPQLAREGGDTNAPV